MTKMNVNNRRERKLDIFPWEIFKSDTISFLSKHIRVFQWLSKSKFVSFMTKVNPDNWNETKSDIFSWDIISNLTTFFIGLKTLKYFNDFIFGIFQFHCKSENKLVNWNEIKGDMCKSDSTLPFYNVVDDLRHC